MEEFLQQLSNPSTYWALLSLTAMLVVLDIDNVVFMTLVSGNLPPAGQKKVLRTGLFIGLGIRVVLLIGIGYLKKLEDPLFTLDIGSWHGDFTAEVLVTLGGGLFLIYKATKEIHDKLEGPEPEANVKGNSMGEILGQIALLSVIFSVDSVLTASGMTTIIWLMCAGMAITFIITLIFAYPISKYVQRHPTLKMLGLAFLLLIGVTLVTDALHVAIPHGYVYFAMAFSLAVELVNINLRKAGTPVQLNAPQLDDPTDERHGHVDSRHRAGNDPLQ